MLWDEKYEVEFDVQIDKINEELYYIEESSTTPTMEEPKKPRKTPEEKAKMKQYLESTKDLPEWLKKDLLKNI